MKKSDELKQKRFQLLTELRGLDGSKMDERKFEDTQQRLEDEIHELSGQIINAEAEEKRSIERAIRTGRTISRGDENDLEKYSFARAIRVALGVETGGIEYEMSQEAIREAKTIGQSIRGFGIPSIVLNRSSSGQNAGADADGKVLVGDDGMRFFEALRNKLTLTRLGARFLTGLQGNVPLIGGGTFTAAFAAEGGEISKTKMSFADRGKLTPRRLGALGAISKELIFQSSIDVERIIVNELINAIAWAIENAAINGNGEAPNPTGILNKAGIKPVVGGENGAAISWEKVVELETAVKKANGHGLNMGYLTNSSVIGKMKTIVKTNTQSFIMENGLLNGYQCYDTNAVPSDLDKGTSTGVCSALIFGAWENLLIAQWGGLDLIVDPYTKKSAGEIELMTNQFIDIGVSNAEHFGAMKDILTA